MSFDVFQKNSHIWKKNFRKKDMGQKWPENRIFQLF